MRRQPDSGYQSCLDAAFRCLSYRPRSEFEVSSRLEKKGFDPKSIQNVLQNLQAQGLIDDLSFARYWKTNRESFSPRGRPMLRSELRQKGVAADIIAAAIEDVDEKTGAYRAAQKKAMRLPAPDYETFRRRLGTFLRRRGFTYQTAQQTVDRLWMERGKHA